MAEDPILLALSLSPSGAVHLDARPSPESAVPAALARALTADLARGPGHAILQLAARHPGETLPPRVAFFRDLGALFLTRACACGLRSPSRVSRRPTAAASRKRSSPHRRCCHVRCTAKLADTGRAAACGSGRRLRW